MALGTRRDGKQHELWVERSTLMRSPKHAFYDKLNELLRSINFDDKVEALCEPYYASGGRPGIAPGVYFRMTLIGYFENIDSQRGIAWRCQDSLSLRRFLGCEMDENTPVHASMTHTRQRLPKDVYVQVFDMALEAAGAHGLVSGEIGVDSTTLEANASLRNIERRDTHEAYPAYVDRLMEEAGVVEKGEKPTAEERLRFDRKRKGKKLSNKDWEPSTDKDARIMRMKNGSFHMGYKAEHAVDLNSGVILCAKVYKGDEGDSKTLLESLIGTLARMQLSKIASGIKAVVADKGYHTLEQLNELQMLGVRGYLAVPATKGQRVWTNKNADETRAFKNNQRRCKREYGKSLHRKRGEFVERSFAHVCNTGGRRRCWVRGEENINKQYVIAAAAHNLAAIMRASFGVGKPRAWVDKGKTFAEVVIACVKESLGALQRLKALFSGSGRGFSRRTHRFRLTNTACPFL